MLFPRSARLGSAELAIDLGSANTVIAHPLHGVVAQEPSVLTLQVHDNGTWQVHSVGSAAKAMHGKTPPPLRTVYPVRHGAVADSELVWLFLTPLLKRITKRRRLRVVLGVSPASSAVAQRALVEPVEAAGAHEVYVIATPLAAALGAGLPIDAPYGSLLVDIGSDTTDIAVVSLGDLVHNTTLPLGSQALDAAIARYLKHTHGLVIGEQTAEQLKIALGSLCPPLSAHSMEVKGVDAVSSAPRVEKISASCLSPVLQALVDRIIAAIRDVLAATPPELLADIIDSGLTLSGGGALLHGLLPYMRESLGLPVHLAPDPLTCAARGASYALAMGHQHCSFVTHLWGKAP